MLVSSEISRAAQLLKDGKLVAFPTETVYGLGANALNDNAVAAIYALKSRPSFNPLIVHVPSYESALRYAEFNKRAEMLAAKFWPGPLTFILPRKESGGISLLATAGLDTVAVRMPAHPLALALLNAAKIPLAAPSANRSGRISPTSAQHVKDEFGNSTPYLLDGGTCEIGLESTVLDLSGDTPVLLRPGAIFAGQMETILQENISHAPGTLNAPLSPGMLASHYAPSLPLRLNAISAQPNEALLAFGPNAPTGAAYTLNLSEKADLREAAANLFCYLRLLDNPCYSGISVSCIPNTGIGTAINDRLKRAAAVKI